MRKICIAALLAATLALAWFGYQPGVSGTLYFDDIPNLGNLQSAGTPLLLVDFIFSGLAGPTGRPLSLLTFALQRAYWPDGLPVLLQTNIALHLLAGIAVFLLAYGLALARDRRFSLNPHVALATTALWLFSPFLASAQLMLVQRMTTLSGLFVFAGLATYVWGRLIQRDKPCAARGLIYGGLLLGTLLATLAKENGALLPSLALVIELTLLKSARELAPVERMVKWFLVGASLAILAYLAMQLPNLMTEGARLYTPWQRLISQPVILLDYLLNLLIPRTENVAPYTNWTNALPGISDARFAIGTLFLAGLVALAIWGRKRAPLLAFSIAFFLVGHLLESSIIYLELYFAHRNYVPAFALYLFISYSALRYYNRNPWIVSVGLGSYAAAFLAVLVLTTSLWGQPLLAAEMWAKQYPEALRAQHALANAYTQEGDYPTATRILDDLEPLAGNPGLYLAQSLLLCQHSDTEVDKRVSEAAERFKRGPAMKGVGETVELLARHALKNQCPTLTTGRVETLADALLSGEAYANEKNARAKAFLAKALLAGERQNLDDMLRDLDQAFSEAQHLDLGFFHVSVLVSQKRFEDALKYLDFLEDQAPSALLKRRIWKERVHQWRSMVADERTTQATRSSQAELRPDSHRDPEYKTTAP